MSQGRATLPQTDGWLNAERLWRHISAYVWARLLLTILLFGVLAWQESHFLNPLELRAQGNIRLAALSFALWALSGLCVRMRVNPRVLAPLQLLVDAVIVTDLVVETGGVESFFSGFYIISIVASAYLVNRTGTLITGFVSAALIAVVGAIDLGPAGEIHTAAAAGALVTQILLRVFAFLLVGALASRLSEELRTTGRALQRETARSTALQEEFSRVVGVIRSGLALFSADGKLRSANPQALQLFPELTQRSVNEVIPGFVPGREGVWEVTVGELRQVLVASTLLEDGGSVVTLEDVTTLRSMEREVQRQERMAAAGRFAAGVAHEVRNPLAALSSAVQMIEVTERDRPLQDVILREVDRLDRLVAQFLETAEPPSPCLESTDIAEIVSDVANTFGQDRRFSGRVRLSLQGGALSPVPADPDQIRQVIWNLLLNAAQAMPSGGTVEISFEDLGGAVVLRVRDQGVGIQEKELSQIFDPFYSSRSGGTGLGLATVDRIVRSHGGHVRVQSKVGEGSVFEIFLPKAPGSPSQPGLGPLIH